MHSPLNQIDEKVILTMITLSVIALFVFAFRYKDYEPCIPAEITINSTTPYANNLIVFTAHAKNISNKKLVWDFGDGSKEKGSKTRTIHTYKKAGRYTVTLLLNKDCPAYFTVTINKAPVFFKKELQAQFTGPTTAVVGHAVIFKDSTPGASSWRWYFGEDEAIDTVQEPIYIFKTPGKKTVRLSVNDKMTGEISVFVAPDSVYNISKEKPVKRRSRSPYIIIPEKPKTDPLNDQLDIGPPEEKEDVPKAPDISDEQMEDMLSQVIDGSRTPSDFSENLCGNLNIIVHYNGNDIAFRDFCNKLRNYFKKSKNIKKLKVSIKKGENNCISSIIVIAERKGLIDRILN